MLIHATDINIIFLQSLLVTPKQSILLHHQKNLHYIKGKSPNARSSKQFYQQHDSPPSRSRGRQIEILQNSQNLRPKTAAQKQQNQFFSYFVDKGNNCTLVKKVLGKRFWLFEATTLSSVNIRWKQTSKDFNYAQLTSNHQSRKLSINHLEFHNEISNKTKLYLNLKSYSKRAKLSISEFVPQTFLINIDSVNFQNEIKDFVDQFCKMKQEATTRNIWLLKPPDLNRGQGIQLFSEIKIFISQLQEYCKARPAINKQKFGNTGQFPLPLKLTQKTVLISYPATKSDILRDENGMTQATFSYEQNLINSGFERIVVLQKYIENPFLYNGRKFDFRVWVLIDHELNYYFFKEGYLRLACEPFELNATSLKNRYIHLTNNAVQKNHDKYGKFELGNQLSMADLQVITRIYYIYNRQNYLHMKGHKLSVREKVIQKMKDIVKITIQSAIEKLIQCSKSYQYELFGYDFMLDNQGKLWLIEINTNPCLEESSPLLGKLIPRLLNDMYRLTIDKIFPPQKNALSQDGEVLEKFYDFLNEFSVPGYNNNENLWELLGKINS